MYVVNCVIKYDATSRNSIHALTLTEAGIMFSTPVRTRPFGNNLSLSVLLQAQMTDIQHLNLNRFERS